MFQAVSVLSAQLKTIRLSASSTTPPTGASPAIETISSPVEVIQMRAVLS